LDEKDEMLYSQPLSKVPIRKKIISVYGITSFEHHGHKLALTFCKYSKDKKESDTILYLALCGSKYMQIIGQLILNISP
jgi:hypothetical protein